MDKANNWVEDFAKKCMYNKTSTMEYFDSCQATREYQMIPEVRKIVNTYFATFCFNNGLWNRIFKNQLIEYLNDSQQTFLFTVLKTKNIPKDRYNQHLMKYYLENLNVEMKDFKGLEKIDVKTKSKTSFAMAYYNQSPALFEKIKEVKEMPIPDKKEIMDDELSISLIKEIPKFIDLGKCLQFNVKGFVKNQLLYLLYGLALYFVKERLSSFESFKDLITTLKSFVQFNLDTKCFNVMDVEKEESAGKENYYNLITFLILGTKGGEKQYNYRYKCAEKYFDLRESDSVAFCGNITEYKKIKDDGPSAEATSYKTAITTEYKTKKDLEEQWKELENEYSENGLSERLIVKWFDSQLLTRSTCLIGCMLIVLKENSENGRLKKIEFLKDEMPDWKSIGMGTFEDTFSVGDEIEELDFSLSSLKVKHVLLLLEEYVKNCEKYAKV